MDTFTAIVFILAVGIVIVWIALLFTEETEIRMTKEEAIRYLNQTDPKDDADNEMMLYYNGTDGEM